MSDKEQGKKKSGSKRSDSPQPKTEKPEPWVSEESITNFFDKVSGATSSAFKFAKKTGGTSYKVGKAIIQSQDQLKLMVSAGQSLKDLREVAGLTVSELSDAINLKDKTIIEAVENGTATLSFELILRLAALLARNDPIPFILKYSRTYAPETWKILNDWGAGRLPLHYERERQFINIYRSQDQARQLSDEGYDRVLEFTKQAFNLSLHFIAEQEDTLREMLEAQEEQMDVLKSKMAEMRKHKPKTNTHKAETKEAPSEPDVQSSLDLDDPNDGDEPTDD
jgi:transcriptional regulator with XRE-family HTH domain